MEEMVSVKKGVCVSLRKKGGDNKQLSDFLDADVGHAAESVGTHVLVVLSHGLLQRVDGEQGLLRLNLGIVHKEHVHELAHLSVLVDHTLDDIRERCGNVATLADHLLCCAGGCE